MNRCAVIPMPEGSVGIVATDRGLSHVVLTRRNIQQAEPWLCGRFAGAKLVRDLLPDIQRQLRVYLQGKPMRFRVSLDLAGLTRFQLEVLEACSKIRYGETMTYGGLAAQLGRPKAARAVGGALARNPVPLVIPCHRVVAGDGSLGGFSAEQGVKLKHWLLQMESRSSRNK